MTAFVWIVVTVLAVWQLWVHFLAIMHLQEVRDAGRLGPIAYRIGAVTLIYGYALDFAVNVVVMSVVMLEPPRETTVTARLKRHASRDTWRGDVARYLARHLLDAFDPSGRHI